MPKHDLFPKHKEFITLVEKIPGGDTKTYGIYFERVNGGQLEYEQATAQPANSDGEISRATRFRINELTLEGYMNSATLKDLMGLAARHHDNHEITYKVIRSLRSGATAVKLGLPAAAGKLDVSYDECTIISPPQPDDADVSNGTAFTMISIRLKPQRLIYSVNGQETIYDPFVGMLSGSDTKLK